MVLRALFGGSKSRSDNRAYDAIAPTLTPALQTGTNALNRLDSELAGGFDAFKKKAGFNVQMGEGLRGITGSTAAGGLLRSGKTGRDVARFGAGLNSTMYGNYLNQIGNVGQLGAGFGQLLVGAGQRSRGSSQNGILPALFG
jgi:hypothetical protein